MNPDILKMCKECEEQIYNHLLKFEDEVISEDLADELSITIREIIEEVIDNRLVKEGE